MGEKRRSHGPSDPYAFDDDLVIVEDPGESAGSADRAYEQHNRMSAQGKSKRESLLMSGGLGDDAVLLDGPDPEGPTFVTETPTKPSVKRSGSSAKKASGLIGGLFGSLKPAQPDNRHKGKTRESDEGASRRKRYEEDEDSSRRLRREARKAHRSRPFDADGLTDAAPVLSPNEDEDAERRRLERRARRAERSAAEAAESQGRDSRKRDKERAREEERKSRRAREDEEAEARRQEEKRARRASRRLAEEQEAREAERRDRRREREREPESTPKSRTERTKPENRDKADEEERRARREERRLRADKDRTKTSRHRSDQPPVDDYFDARNGAHGKYGASAATAPPMGNRPYLSGGPDKTSSWVNSVNEDPPEPPPLTGTIVDGPNPLPTTVADEGEDETTARELRRRQRRERERRNEVNSSDERRKQRREERRARDRDGDGLTRSDGSGGAKSRRTGRTYGDMASRPPDGRHGADTGERKSWLKKFTGF